MAAWWGATSGRRWGCNDAGSGRPAAQLPLQSLPAASPRACTTPTGLPCSSGRRACSTCGGAGGNCGWGVVSGDSAAPGPHSLAAAATLLRVESVQIHVSDGRVQRLAQVRHGERRAPSGERRAASGVGCGGRASRLAGRPRYERASATAAWVAQRRGGSLKARGARRAGPGAGPRLPPGSGSSPGALAGRGGDRGVGAGSPCRPHPPAAARPRARCVAFCPAALLPCKGPCLQFMPHSCKPAVQLHNGRRDRLAAACGVGQCRKPPADCAATVGCRPRASRAAAPPPPPLPVPGALSITWPGCCAGSACSQDARAGPHSSMLERKGRPHPAAALPPLARRRRRPPPLPWTHPAAALAPPPFRHLTLGPSGAAPGPTAPAARAPAPQRPTRSRPAPPHPPADPGRREATGGGAPGGWGRCGGRPPAAAPARWSPRLSTRRL